MGLVIKTKSLKLLKDYGCDANGIATLASLGGMLQKGSDFITFWHGTKGYKLKLNWGNSHLTLKDDLNSFMLFVLGEIEAEKKHHQSIPDAPEGATITLTIPDKPVSDVLPLREAKAMYQRVRGTSDGSVYVVVALSDKLKVAARIQKDNGLSVRVEGPGIENPIIRAKLEEQELTFKAKTSFSYMSGHYTTSVNAPPAKVLGAVLLGSGIDFDTPLPKVALVKAGSA